MKDPVELAREVLAMIESGTVNTVEAHMQGYDLMSAAPILAREVIRLHELSEVSFEEAKEVLAEGVRDRQRIAELQERPRKYEG